MTVTSTDTVLNGPIFNIMTLSIFSQLANVETDQFYFVNPQFKGNKIVSTDDNGNFVESSVSTDDIILKNPPLYTLPSSGTVAPAPNSYNYIAPTGDITIVLPTVTDTSIMNEVEIIVNQTSLVGFDFGTVLWGVDDLPSMGVAIWDLIFTYCPGVNKWLGSYKKWENS